jgi:hypothetical protein
MTFKENLMHAAENVELWAVWTDPAEPDGIGAALISLPEHGQGEVAAVRVADEDAAMALNALIDNGAKVHERRVALCG